MHKLFLAVFAALVLSGASALAQPQTPPASLSPAPDYADPATWLCRPGRADHCAQDQTTTVVAANGALTREEFRADPAAAIDCFYVYPTVSNDPTANSDMTANAEEQFVIAQQFARFGAKCRLFAPLYRQVTLTALRAGLAGTPMPADRQMAYADVKAAWEHYLAHDNNGRGVVLIGHSQGAGILTALIANEIDGKPVASKLVSALILGANVPTPRGRVIGGAFKSIPLCTNAAQTGCVVSYVSFRESAPPPPTSRFGTALSSTPLALPTADLTAACVNPAALLRGRASADAVDLHAYHAGAGSAFGAGAEPRPWSNGQGVTTPFVSTPGLLTGQCVSTPTHSYLSVRVNGKLDDPRTDDIPGDVVVAGRVQPDWGLHLIDVNLAMGDLVALVGVQSEAYRRLSRPTGPGFQ
jgi:pimeloyl-ACP methyl ester carboxylesterase